MKVSKLPYRRVTREEMTDGLQRVIERVKAAQSVEEILAQGVPKAVILYKSRNISRSRRSTPRRSRCRTCATRSTP